MANSFTILYEMVRVSSMPILLRTQQFMICYPHAFFLKKAKGIFDTFWLLSRALQQLLLL